MYSAYRTQSVTAAHRARVQDVCGCFHGGAVGYAGGAACERGLCGGRVSDDVVVGDGHAVFSIGKTRGV